MKNKNEQNINITNSSNFKIGDINANINEGKGKKESKKELQIDKEKLKSMISKNDLQGVIDELLKSPINKDYFNQIILLNGRLNQVKTEKRINIISNPESQVEINNITNGLIQIIDLV